MKYEARISRRWMIFCCYIVERKVCEEWYMKLKICDKTLGHETLLIGFRGFCWKKRFGEAEKNKVKKKKLSVLLTLDVLGSSLYPCWRQCCWYLDFLDSKMVVEDFHRPLDGCKSCLLSEKSPGTAIYPKQGTDVFVPWVPWTQWTHNQGKDVSQGHVFVNFPIKGNFQVPHVVIGDIYVDEDPWARKH